VSYNKHIDMSTFAALCLQVTLSPKLVSSSSVLSEQNTHKRQYWKHSHSAVICAGLFYMDWSSWYDSIFCSV